MESTYIALIAMAGTLLGSSLTYLLQRKHLDRAEDRAAAERLRHERISVYSSFLEEVATFRGRQILRWTSARDHGKESDNYAEARLDGHRAQAIARGAMYRVQLVSNDPAIVSIADSLMTQTIAIIDASDNDDLKVRADHSRVVTEEFIQVASAQLAR